MITILTVIAVTALVPSVAAAVGDVQDRVRSHKLQRELVKAFRS